MANGVDRLGHISVFAASVAACAACFSLRAVFRVCHDLLSVFGFGFSFLCDSRLRGVVVVAMYPLFSVIGQSPGWTPMCLQCSRPGRRGPMTREGKHGQPPLLAFQFRTSPPAGALRYWAMGSVDRFT
jgi:hypothetical protein